MRQAMRLLTPAVGPLAPAASQEALVQKQTVEPCSREDRKHASPSPHCMPRNASISQLRWDARPFDPWHWWLPCCVWRTGWPCPNRGGRMHQKGCFSKPFVVGRFPATSLSDSNLRAACLYSSRDEQAGLTESRIARIARRGVKSPDRAKSRKSVICVAKRLETAALRKLFGAFFSTSTGSIPGLRPILFWF